MTAGRRPAVPTDRGFAMPVLLAVLGVVVVLCLALIDVAAVLTAHGRVRTAADAAALAAATEQWPPLGLGADPHGAAASIAQSNGATLELCECELRDERAVVEVSVRPVVRLLRVAPSVVRARAAARVDPGVLFTPPPAGVSRTGPGSAPP